MITRRQFFSRMRKLGYSKSSMQMTRIGLTYEKKIGDDRVSVTVPKHHEQTFTILGGAPYSGIFVEAIKGRTSNWGIPVAPADLGMKSMLEVCLGLCDGTIMLSKPQG